MNTKTTAAATKPTTKPPAGASNAPASGTKPARVAPQLTGISSAIAMPERLSTRGSKTNYPFANLAVGQSFGVKNKTAANLTSIVSNQNRKDAVQARNPDGSVKMKTVEIKDANGAVVGTQATTEPEMIKRHFFAADCNPATDPEGASVRVWRDA